MDDAWKRGKSGGVGERKEEREEKEKNGDIPLAFYDKQAKDWSSMPHLRWAYKLAFVNEPRRGLPHLHC